MVELLLDVANAQTGGCLLVADAWLEALFDGVVYVAGVVALDLAEGLDRDLLDVLVVGHAAEVLRQLRAEVQLVPALVVGGGRRVLVAMPGAGIGGSILVLTVLMVQGTPVSRILGIDRLNGKKGQTAGGHLRCARTAAG